MARSRRRSPAWAASPWLSLLLVASWSVSGAIAEEEPPAWRLAQVTAPRPLLAALARRRLELRRDGATAPPEPTREAPPVYLPPPAAAAEAGIGSLRSAEPLAVIVPETPLFEAEDIAPAAGPDPEPPEPERGPMPVAAPFASPAAREVLPPERVQRRDPIEPPLLEEDAWSELILSVVLNGQPVSDGTVFLKSPEDGALYAPYAALQAWRIKLEPLRIVTLQGDPYYPLAAIPGAELDVNEAELAVAIALPADQFLPFSFEGSDTELPPPRAGRGAFLDYDFVASAGDEIERNLDGLVEVGGFAGVGTGVSSFRLADIGGATEPVRLDTTFSRDLPQRRSTVRVGDSLSVGGAFARSVRFGGLQYGTNFGTDPEFVTFPSPAIGGLAEQASVVDVLIDNLERVRGEVPPGPFAIENLPVVTGAGELQLRVTDLLGRERIVSQPYYVSARLLKRGLHDFSYEAGFEREGFGEASFTYGEPLMSATHRYGLSDRVTGEGHLELTPNLQGAALGGSALLGRYGVASFGAGASLADAGTGGMAELGYDFDGRAFNFSARTRLESDAFRQIGYDGGSQRVDQLNLGVDLLGYGRLGLFLLNRESYDSEDLTSVTGLYSLPVGPGSLSLRAAQFTRPDPELTLAATYALPLGPTRNLSTEVETQDGERRARAQFRQTRGSSDLGFDYRLGAGFEQGTGELDARVSYQSSIGAAELELERGTSGQAGRLGVNGSVAMVDGDVEVSRRIGRAFGLVSLPGYSDVRVYLDNREVGRTDADGQILLPSLRPYEANRVKLEVQDLPLDAAVAEEEVVAVPFERSGVTVSFDVARNAAATATLQDNRDQGLPAGLTLVSDDGGVTATVGRDGFAQVEGGSASAPSTIRGELGGRIFTCVLPPSPADDLLPDMGIIRCEG